MQLAADTRDLPRIDGARVAILQAAWFPEYVTALADCARALLVEQGADVEDHVLPGSLELSYAAEMLCADTTRPRPEAIVCFGVIVKGDTLHFEMIVQESARALGDVGLRWRVPVINEIIPVLAVADAAKRCAADELNKGIEAAVAAIRCIAWRRAMFPQQEPELAR
ncbi:MAG: 6,7-dimethyl-8-ribityllumazine synthase [Sphingobium sp.]